MVSTFFTGAIGNSNSIQFSQLDPFYQQSLFGLRFDYNHGISQENSLQLHTNLVTGQEINDSIDPDPIIDNNISIIGQDSYGIKSLLFATENIGRSEFIPLFGTLEWQASLPYFKYISMFDLPSGESVILTQDILGLALKLDGQNFLTDQYLVGYANIPVEFLEFLFESLNPVQMAENSINGYTSPIDMPNLSNPNPMRISIEENDNELIITMTYTNISYLFQTNPISIEHLSSFSLSENFVLIEFESISYITRILKYSTSSNTGVETQVEMSVGRIRNLLINEKLPSEVSWDSASETHIVKKYEDLINIDETISWYKEVDIEKRMALFNQASLSFLGSHNLGVVSNTESQKNSFLKIDGQNRTKNELLQMDLSAERNISLYQDSNLLLLNQINGYDYALHLEPNLQHWSLSPVSIKSIALNQHPSLSGNILFLDQASILNPFLVDVLRRFTANLSTSTLSAEQILKTATLYLTSAEYIQEYCINSWTGYPTKIKSLSTAILNSNNLEVGLSRISFFPLFPGLLSIFFITVYQTRKRRM